MNKWDIWELSGRYSIDKVIGNLSRGEEIDNETKMFQTKVVRLLRKEDGDIVWSSSRRYS